MAEENQEASHSSKHNVIIIKKGKKHHEHPHGGAWKVAYADFVTAMMAFFLLMWLVNSVSSDKLRGIAEYFTPSIGIEGLHGTGLDGGTDPNTSKGLLAPSKANSSSDSKNVGGDSHNDKAKKESIVDSDSQKLLSVMNNLEKTLDGSSEVEKFKDNISIERTAEGLRIQIMDSINRSVFRPGTSDIAPYMTKFLDVVSDLIKNVPNYVSIEGHTSPGDARAGIDQWDLSLQRADAIRKFYQDKLQKNQILKVIGRSNTEPYDLKDPNNPSNSRIVIVLLNAASVGKIQSASPSQID